MIHRRACVINIEDPINVHVGGCRGIAVGAVVVDEIVSGWSPSNRAACAAACVDPRRIRARAVGTENLTRGSRRQNSPDCTVVVNDIPLNRRGHEGG